MVNGSAESYLADAELEIAALKDRIERAEKHLNVLQKENREMNRHRTWNYIARTLQALSGEERFAEGSEAERTWRFRREGIKD